MGVRDEAGVIHMAQFKIYGNLDFLRASSSTISAAIHRASVQSLGLPVAKRFHRFIPLEEWQFVYPPDRTSSYIIIEVTMFAGRSIDMKKAFYAALLRNLHDDCGIKPSDIEMTIIETPRHDWLVRGVPGDELSLPYSRHHVAESDA